jgi:hypothetical protein
MGTGDISGRWSQQASQTDRGFTIGDAFKGADYLYNAKAGEYGARAGQKTGVYPQLPIGVLPSIGVKIPTTNYTADPLTVWKDYYEHQRRMILLDPYTDNAPYGI